MSDLPEAYRPCVGIMLVNGEGLVFVGQRIDNKDSGAWQMPQGGVDEGEDLRAAALRESTTSASSSRSRSPTSAWCTETMA